MPKNTSWAVIAVLSFAVGYLISERPAEAGTGTQWEYRCVAFKKSPTRPANDLGKRGWELVGQVRYAKNNGVKFSTCFKRQK